MALPTSSWVWARNWSARSSTTTRWRKEGEAQQKKGTERLRALQDQVKAEAKEAKAETFERQQRAAQKMKESA